MLLFSGCLLWCMACDGKSDGEDSTTDSQVTDDTALTRDSSATGDTAHTGLATDSETTLLDTSDTSDVSTQDSVDTATKGDTGDSGGVDVVLSSEQYVMVSSGWYHSCGLKVDGTIECWGGVEGTPSGMEGQFSSIGNMAASAFCGIGVDGMIGCREDAELDYATTTSRPEETLLSVDCGWEHCCAITTENELTCWGADDGGKHDYGQVTDTPTTGQYSQVAVGYYHSCALDLDGMATCWGGTAPLQPPPEEPLIAISAGRNSNTCGLKADGRPVCWDGGIRGDEPLGGGYVSIGMGAQFACATDMDDAMTCWGITDLPGYEEASLESGYTQVSGGLYHACAVRTDGYVRCWGADSYGETTPP